MSIHYNNRPSDGWIKVFRHYSGNGLFFSSANNWAEAKRSNRTTPLADKFSILDTLSGIQGPITFKIVYPTLALTNIWIQSNNPVTDTVASGGVIGYIPISIQASTQGWGGLEYSSVPGGPTFLDGTVLSGNWYYAVGSASSFGTATQFPGPNGSADLVELWVKIR